MQALVIRIRWLLKLLVVEELVQRLLQLRQVQAAVGPESLILLMMAKALTIVMVTLLVSHHVAKVLLFLIRASQIQPVRS